MKYSTQPGFECVVVGDSYDCSNNRTVYCIEARSLNEAVERADAAGFPRADHEGGGYPYKANPAWVKGGVWNDEGIGMIQYHLDDGRILYTD